MLKNCGIAERRDPEDTRELTGREADDRWASRSVGRAGQPHTSLSCTGFSHSDFLSLSNPEKYIYALCNVKRMAEV